MAEKIIQATLKDAENLFRHSEGFRFAEEAVAQAAFAKLSIEFPEGKATKDEVLKLGILTPVVTLSAIRLEFLLKVLLILDNGQYRAIHRLHTLFNDLIPKTQNRVRSQYEALSASDDSITSIKPNFDKGIENVLRKSTDAFVKFRYFPTENFADMEGFIASDVTEATLLVIGEDHPEWWD